MRSIQDLPPNAQAIAKIIGMEATLTLAKQCKNRCLYIPHNSLPEDHPIINMIGRNLARKLQHAFRREIIRLPRCTNFWRNQRNEEIRKAALTMSHNDLAKEFNLTRKQINLILNPRLAELQRQRMRERRKKSHLCK